MPKHNQFQSKIITILAIFCTKFEDLHIKFNKSTVLDFPERYFLCPKEAKLSDSIIQIHALVKRATGIKFDIT